MCAITKQFNETIGDNITTTTEESFSEHTQKINLNYLLNFRRFVIEFSSSIQEPGNYTWYFLIFLPFYLLTYPRINSTAIGFNVDALLLHFYSLCGNCFGHRDFRGQLLLISCNLFSINTNSAEPLFDTCCIILTELMQCLEIIRYDN